MLRGLPFTKGVHNNLQGRNNLQWEIFVEEQEIIKEGTYNRANKRREGEGKTKVIQT